MPFEDMSNLLETPAKGGFEDMSDLLTPAKPEKPSGLLRRAADIPLGIARGFANLPGAAVGLADTVSGGAAGRGVDAILEATGAAADAIGLPAWARPSRWGEQLAELYTPETKAALRGVSETAEAAEAQAREEGAGAAGQIAASAGGAIKGLAQNPSAIAALAAENYGGMKAIGMGTARLLKGLAGELDAAVKAGTMTSEAADKALGAAAVKYATAGEGILTSGQTGQSISRENPEADWVSRLAAIPAGVITGGISRGVAKIPGLGDVEASMATAALGRKTGFDGGLAKRAGKGFLSEGVLEELPQSAQEQVWQNIGSGKEWQTGVGAQAVEGMAAGGVMGGGIAALQSPKQKPAPSTPPADIVDAKSTDEAVERFKFNLQNSRSDIDLAEIAKTYKDQTPEEIAANQARLLKVFENDVGLGQAEDGTPTINGSRLRAIPAQELPTEGEGLTRNGYEAIATMAKALGKDVVVYEDDGKMDDGFVFQPDVVFISNKTKEADSAVVAFHEVQHLSEQGEAQANYAKVVQEELTERAMARASERHEVESPLSKARLMQEIRADIAGDAMADPTFHNRVIEKMREQFGDKAAEANATSLLDSIKQMIERVKAVLTGTTYTTPDGKRLATEYVNNLERVHDALAAAIADNFIREGYRPPGAQTNASQMLLSQALAMQAARVEAENTPWTQRTLAQNKLLQSKPMVAPKGASMELKSAIAAAQKAPFDRTSEERLNIEAIKLGVRRSPKAQVVLDSQPASPKSPEFKAWFGASKAADKNGNPLTLAHATNQDITQFKPGVIWLGEPGFANLYAKARYGYWKTADLPWQDQTMVPSGVNIVPLHVRVEKPFDFSPLVEELATPATDDAIARVAQALGLNPAAIKLPTTKTTSRGDTVPYTALAADILTAPAVVEALKARGYDGFTATEDGHKVWAVFKPEQVKSVLNDNPTDSPEILKSPKAQKDKVTGVALTKAMRLSSLEGYLYGELLPLNVRTQAELGELLQEMSTLGAPARTEDTPENREFVARVVEHEARLALGQEGNAVGWYGKTTDAALRIAALIHPEIATDADARFAFTYALAVTSNGATIAENVRNSFTVYKSYAKNGRMPVIGFGVRLNNMKLAFQKWNEVTEVIGVPGFRDFMLKKHPVRDLKKFNKEIKEVVTDEVYGGTIIGPKIGGAFLQNLNGNHDALAMDRWFMRTWGRITGDLVGYKKGLLALKDAPTSASQRHYIRATIATALERLRADHPTLTTSDLQALLWYPEKDLYAMHGVNDENGKPTDYEIETANYARAKGVNADSIEQARRVQPDEPAGRRAGDQYGGTDQVRAASPKRRGSGSRSLEEAQGVAAQAAEDEVGLLGAPSAPLYIEGDGYYVPGPVAVARRAARAYMTGREYRPVTQYKPVDVERARRIAAAFDEMAHTPNDPEVKAAYRAMIDETVAQWQAIKATGLKVEFIKAGDPDPYAVSPRLAIQDVIENNHLWVFPTDSGFGSDATDISGNPLLEFVNETIDGHHLRANDVFRIVHDYFGHIKDGNGFRAAGEENAWRSHAAMYSPLARRAMTTETRGQNSWVNFGPYGAVNQTASASDTHYAPQKIGLLPQWVTDDGAGDTLGADGQDRATAPASADGRDGAVARKSPKAGAIAVTGVHYSGERRDTIAGARHGTGYKGAEAERIRTAADARLRSRVYAYVNTGNGITPEKGVGGVPHVVQMQNLYDADADPLDLATKDDNAFESAVLDAGFDGYLVRGGHQGVAVLIGPASAAVRAENTDLNLRTRDLPTPPAPQYTESRKAYDAFMADNSLPSGSMTGENWMKLVPGVALNPDEVYYKDAVGRKVAAVAAARDALDNLNADATEQEREEAEAALRLARMASPKRLLAPNGKPSKLPPHLYVMVRTPAFKKWFGDWEQFAKKKGGVWADDKKAVSKVVDENGEPLVVYHGTDAGGFTEFSQDASKKERASFFTSDPQTARSYSGTSADIDLTEVDDEGYAPEQRGVYSVFLNIRDPHEAYFEGAHWDGTRTDQYQVVQGEDSETVYSEDGRAFFSRDEAEALAEASGGTVERADDHYETTDSVVRDAIKYGGDGAIIRDVTDPGPYNDVYDPATVYAVLNPNQIKSVDNRGTFDPREDSILKSPKLPAGVIRTRETQNASNSHAGDPSPAEARRVEAALTGKTPIQAAQWLVANGNDVEKLVAERVLVQLEKLKAAGVKLDLKIAHVGDTVPRSLIGARGIVSWDLTNKREMTVWLNGADVSGKVGVSESTLLHELVHMATAGAIQLGNRTKNNSHAVAKHVSDLYAVSNAVINHFNARVKASRQGGEPLTEYENKILKRQNNALLDPHEVVAWALSDRDSQAYLETIPYRGHSSAWTAFVSAVRALLGIPVRANTALSEVLRVSEAIMAEDISGMIGAPAAAGVAAQERRASPKSDPNAVHLGDGGVARDTVRARMDGGRSTGHFGTGTYFLSRRAADATNEASDPLSGRFGRDEKLLTTDGLNLARPRDPQALHDGLREVNRLAGNTAPLDFETPSSQARKAQFKLALALGFLRESEIKDAIKYEVELERNGLGEAEQRTASTRVMQRLGYDGVDVRGTKLDNTDYGSVIYVSNPDILKSPKSAAFKKWFGDSKVVDENGDPLVVYHGTNRDIETFDVSKAGSNTPNSGMFGRAAAYTSSSAREANAYAAGNPLRVVYEDGQEVPTFVSTPAGTVKEGANVMPLYVRIENPLRVNSYDDIGEVIQRLAGRNAANVTAQLKELGYDGVIVDGGREVVPFEPDQIKSVFNDNPTSNPDILKSPKIVGASRRPYDAAQKKFFENVGRTIDEKSFVDKVKDLRKDLGKKLAQGLVDQFAPLKELSPMAYMLARLSKGTAGAVEALLRHGKLKLVGSVYDADQSGGFVDTVARPLQGEIEDFMWWVAANRAEMLTAQDRERLFSASDIKAGKSLANGTTDYDYTLANGKVTRNRAEIFKDTLVKFDAFNKNVMDMAEQSGLIDGASRPEWERQFYVPFYRVGEEAGTFVGGKSPMSLVRQTAFKRLKGGDSKLNSDILANVLRNWTHLIDASAKNRAAQAALESAVDMGVAVEADADTVKSLANSVGKKSATVWFRDNGVPRHFFVNDPFVLTAITSLEYAGMRNGVMDAMSTFKHVLTVGVTASPAFKVKNLIRDSLQAVATSPIGFNIVNNVKEGIAASDPNSQTYVSALASGGLIRFGTMLEGRQSDRVRQLVRQTYKESNIINSDAKLRAVYDKFLEPAIAAYNELGNRSEEINRASLYKQLISQGMAHGEAALLARDLMDFSLQGSWTGIRFLTQVVPFMNARMQGLYKLGRAAQEDPRRFASVVAATAMFSIALMAAYSDDDDWKKREDWDRDNYWWFKIAGHKFVIPKPFEIGAFATLAERGLEYFTDKEMTGERFRSRVMALLSDNLSMNPVPQMVKPLLAVYSNKDSFSGRPIETMGMERLQPDYRYTSRSSMAARALSTAGQAVTSSVGVNFASPVQIDNMLRGYFGWLGTFIVGASDMAVRPLTNEPTRPSMDVIKFVTQDLVAELPADQSRYVSHMYEQAKQIEQAWGTYQSLVKTGKREEAKEFLDENRDKLMKYRAIEKVKSTESKLNERIRMIERSNKTPDEKREMIRAVNEQKDKIARLVY